MKICQNTPLQRAKKKVLSGYVRICRDLPGFAAGGAWHGPDHATRTTGGMGFSCSYLIPEILEEI